MVDEQTKMWDNTVRRGSVQFPLNIKDGRSGYPLGTVIHAYRELTNSETGEVVRPMECALVVAYTNCSSDTYVGALGNVYVKGANDVVLLTPHIYQFTYANGDVHRCMGDDGWFADTMDTEWLDNVIRNPYNGNVEELIRTGLTQLPGNNDNLEQELINGLQTLPPEVKNVLGYDAD